jgi:hypothetical protein
MQMPVRRSSRALRLAVLAAALLVVAVAAGCVPNAPANVSGPITGGTGVPQPANLNAFDLAQVGYQQSEYALSGIAAAYTNGNTPLSSDGKWSVTPASFAAYTTRAVVYRPTDPSKFNGTVVVEWLNVSGGVDADPDWTMTHNELIRDGFAWVGVSAQAAGLDATKTADPVRYASLHHPGDSYSYDIFSQAGRAVRANPALFLGGLTPNRVLAVGESQSAGRMVTYLDAVHPLAHVYDGFLVHSRSAVGAALSQPPQPAIATPSPTLIRDDLDVPVFVFQTETDVFNSNTRARQADTTRFRMWEAAGTSHFDQYGLAIGPSDTGDGQGAVANLEAMQHPTNEPFPGFVCDVPINTGGAHWLLNAAIYHLNQWVKNGTLPPTAPLLQVQSTSPVVFAKDANGNTLGGVRSPQVDAPIAALGGTDNSGTGSLGQFCRLFGTTVPFTPQQLAALYPNHDQFVTKWNRATRKLVKGGFLLKPDAAELKAAAAQSTIGG